MNFFKNKKIIKFDVAEDAVGMPDVKPIKNFIPSWYKKTKSFNDKGLGEFDVENKKIHIPKSFKNCVPFLDSLTAGYTVTTWNDIFYDTTSENNQSIVYWAEGPDPISLRDDSNNLNLPVPTGFNPSHLVWKMPYCFKVPDGYSLLITHPLNRFDLPYITFSGVVDADSILTNGKIPFFIKNNEKGVIRAGSPIIQIIPFKREDWKIEKDESLRNLSKESLTRQARVFYNFYRNNYWYKKNYE